MFAYLKGKIQHKQEQSIILNLGSIGFEIFLETKELNEVQISEEWEFFVYHHITDRNQELYGFKTYEKLEFFKTLLSVSGIGPKSAIKILSKATVLDLTQAVNQGEAKYLIRLGISAKIAEHIILELKNKILTQKIINSNSQNNFKLKEEHDLFNGLESLGYKRNQILNCLTQIPKDVMSLEEKFKFALKWLST